MLTFSVQNCKVHKLVHIELLCNRFSLKSLESIRYGNRMDPQKVGCGYMDWIGLNQNRDGWRRLVSAVMNLRVP